MSGALKNGKIRYFRNEEAFSRYLDRLTRNGGYVLVETSPLIGSRAESASRLSLFQGQVRKE